MTTKQKQCLLAYLGYYTGAIDGVWGNQSRAAAEAFLRAYRLSGNGDFDETAQRRIREIIATGEGPAAADWWQDIRYFQRAEFRCPCGRCGGFPVEPQEKMVRTVDEIRHRLGVPVSIVDAGGSGIRCPEHNAEVGGVSNSEHLYGRAADLHSSASPAKMKAVAEEILGNTGGIGLYDWGIHVDTGKYSRWNG